jgi:hypothetical protein
MIDFAGVGISGALPRMEGEKAKERVPAPAAESSVRRLLEPN